MKLKVLIHCIDIIKDVAHNAGYNTLQIPVSEHALKQTAYHVHFMRNKYWNIRVFFDNVIYCKITYYKVQQRLKHIHSAQQEV